MTRYTLVLQQVVPRVWPSRAVHDTVEAVMRGAAFRRTLQESIADRILLWIGELLDNAFRHIRGTGAARDVALGLAVLLVLLIVARAILSVRARDEGVFAPHRGRAAIAENPWRMAERLAADGKYEEAAHAFYQGVLASLALAERLRRDPSKTSGDYARELRARGSAAYPPFRAFSRRFDAAIYGHDACDAALIADLRRLAILLAPRARAA